MDSQTSNESYGDNQTSFKRYSSFVSNDIMAHVNILCIVALSNVCPPTVAASPWSGIYLHKLLMYVICESLYLCSTFDKIWKIKDTHFMKYPCTMKVSCLIKNV